MYWNKITITQAKSKVQDELSEGHGEAEVIIDNILFTLQMGTNGLLVLSSEALTVHGLSLDQTLGYILGYYESKVFS